MLYAKENREHQSGMQVFGVRSKDHAGDRNPVLPTNSGTEHDEFRSPVADVTQVDAELQLAQARIWAGRLI
jgi:hypothetical protein